MRVNEVGGCFGCPQTRSNGLFITPDGEGTSGILFVGDSPGKDAAFQGRNFSGADGAHYDKWLKWINLTRLQVYTANSMWCPPPQDGWIDAKRLTPDAFASLNNCRGHLDDFIAQHRDKIKVIVPMGPVALGRVCSVERIEKNQGYVHETGWGIPAVPTFHPRYVMMGKTKLTPAVMNALRRAQSIANGTYKASEFKLILDPPVDELRSYLGKFPHDIPEITTDIETPDSSTLDEDDLDLDAEGDDEEGEVEEAVLPGEHRDASYNIIRASFSLEPNVAVTFPFEAPYIDVYFDLLRRSQIMWEWTNQHFDSFRLRAAGATFNKVGSAMWAHHFWQSDIPKALAFAAPFWYRGPAWKQLASSSPSYYSAMDSAVQDACLQGTRDALKAEGRWDAFMKHGVEADAIMVRMCEPGFKIDRAMQSKFKEVVIKECARAIGDLQTKVPEDVRGIHPKKGYSKVPKEGAAIPGAVVDKDTEPAIRDILLANSKLGQRVIGGEEKWAWLKPFNINSSQQVAELIKSLGLPVPFDRKKNKNTTEAKHLKKLAKRNAIFHDLLNARQYGKMASTYFWPLDGDDCVYTHYGMNPSTWRKNSYQINSQNLPKRSDLAQQFRRMIIARPGHVFVAFDSSAIEAVLVGFYAGSKRYIQLAKAGVHDWLTSCKLGRPIPLDLLFSDFDAFKAQCKAVKRENPVLREQMKRIIHLSGYKGTPSRILEEYPDDFRDIKEATDFQNLFFNTEPGQDVVRWQNQTLTLAHKEHVLKTPFGYWHYFFSVFAWDSQYKQWRLGTDAKRAIAFRPQATASAIQTEILLWIAAEHPEMLPWLRLIIHDEIILEVPEAFQADAIAAMEVGMTQGWPALDGLGIGAEGKWGKNLGEWSPSNLEGMRSV